MNKNILVLLAATSVIVACTNEPKVSSENSAGTDTTAAAATYKSYGDTINATGAVDMAKFAELAATQDSIPVKLDCEIITSCVKKGCWMDVKMAGDQTMKVHFRDYGFFVPTSGLEGKNAVIAGYALKEVTDVATLRHYAEDAGQSKEECEKITAADTSWTFMADGVLIRE